jgi:hypothetical protein
MITKLPESSGTTLGFLIQGKLADEDYQDVLIPALEEATKAGGKIRILFVMENFAGWTPQGAWDDFINWPRFLSMERFAVVIDENWHDFMTWLFSVFARLSHSEIKFFHTGQRKEAWEWLKA